jgi:hypothetical protein
MPPGGRFDADVGPSLLGTFAKFVSFWLFFLHCGACCFIGIDKNYCAEQDQSWIDHFGYRYEVTRVKHPRAISPDPLAPSSNDRYQVYVSALYWTSGFSQR